MRSTMTATAGLWLVQVCLASVGDVRDWSIGAPEQQNSSYGAAPGGQGGRVAAANLRGPCG